MIKIVFQVNLQRVRPRLQNFPLVSFLETPCLSVMTAKHSVNDYRKLFNGFINMKNSHGMSVI